MQVYKDILKTNWGIEQANLKPLIGYDSVNIQVTLADKTQFVLKEFKYTPQEIDILDGENHALAILNQNLSYQFPKPLKGKNNQYLLIKPELAPDKFYRLQTFVPGTFLAEVDHNDEMIYSLGKMLGSMNTELKDYYHAGVFSRRLHWDLRFLTDSEYQINFVKEPANQKLVKYFFSQFKEKVLPLYESLRKGVIHCDANDWNVLTNGTETTGIIDFGDIVHTPVINEIAIASMYIILKKQDPIEAVCKLLEGYHAVFPLQANEMNVLFYLIAGRLSKSVINSAEASTHKPDSEYITISENPAWDTLEKWIAINPIAAQRSFYRAIGLDFQSVNKKTKILADRKQCLSSNISISYQDPIEMHSAAFQYMFDSEGNTYLDLYNNIPHVGHCHPDVVSAGQKQMAQLNTNTRYLYETLTRYSQKLLGTFPEKLSKVFFVNSGSAANDLAIRLAKSYSKHSNIAVMSHGYHGHTETCISLSSYKYDGKGGKGKADYIYQLPLPESDDESRSWESLIKSELNGKYMAAFICEPIVGCGGQMPLPVEYMKALYQFIQDQGGVCISDEVQTGFGRLGSCFWGYELYNVIPDIVTLGKPMGNGHPMSAVVTTQAVADSFDNGMEFFSSFGGNPVSCEIGEAVLNVIESEKLQQQAHDIGNYLKDKMAELVAKFDFLGEIRGEGLFLGLELKKKGVPQTELAAFVKNQLKERYILVGTDGPFDNVIKIKPPLCFNRRNADAFLSALNDICITI